MRVVIVGAGDVGTYLARALSSSGADVTVVDRRQDALERVEEGADVQTLHGDATHWTTLRAAGITDADSTLVMTSSDDANIVVAALAASEGARRTVARVDDPGFYRSAAGLERGVLGIDAVLCASRLVSQELLRMVHAVDAQFVGFFGGNAAQVALVSLGESSPLLGNKAAGFVLPDQAHIAGVVRDMTLRGCEEIGRLEADDSILIAGGRSLDNAIRAVSGARPHRRTVIIGGGDVGFQLARGLVQTGRRVQVIELDHERCQFLARELPQVTVIHGDGTNINCLRDEAVDRADFVLAVTRSDEVNLMASLLAKELGVPWTFSLVHRPGYSDVYTHLGIHGTAGPHDLIWRMVRWMLPTQGPLSQEALPNCTHELFEFAVPGTLGGSFALGDVVLPAEAVPVALVRGTDDVLAPKPPTALRGGDHIVLGAPSSLVGNMQRRIKALGGRGGE